MARRRHRLRRKLLVPFEWLAIGLGLCVIPWLTRKGLFRLCDVLSRIMYRFDRRGKRQALLNVRVLRGTCTGAEGMPDFDPDNAEYRPTKAEELIIRRSYRNMARSVGYAFWTCWRARARCEDAGIMSVACGAFLRQNRPAVTVSGHIGCWEILSQLAFLEGHRMMSVAKNIGTNGMTALLMRARRSIGQEIVSAEGAFKPLMAGIRAGKSLGLLVDQRVSPRRGGIWVRFLGRPVSVSAAPAFFAAKANAPILIAWSRPLRDGRYRCEFVESIAASEARDIWATTQRCTKALERIVRRHPSCWVLNYNYFCHRAKPEELRTLAEREAKAK